ncbi:MAG: ATP-binding protein [Polyangiales bacterium]
MTRSALTLLRGAALRIVLVEDSPRDARILEAQLTDAGAVVQWVRVDTREAFVAALGTGPVDLILSDFHVPSFSGDEALSIAAEARPEVPFIFVSGALGEHAAVELLKRGATDYVLKDQLERLVPSLARALREASDKRERKHTEAALHERERMLSTLMRNLPGMAFRRQLARPWRLEFASNGCQALTGFEVDAFYRDASLGWETVMHPDDVPRVARELAEALAAQRQLTTTYRIRTATGQERWVWERSAGNPSDDGAPPAVEGFATDITQQKATEAEVRRRVEFEQQLIGIVSHDLRNPLQSIALGASVLLRQEGLNAAGTRQARRILASAERAARMIRDLLDFTQARLGGGIPVTPRDTSLSVLIAQVVDEFETTHPERRIEHHADGELVGAFDPDRVTQALTNLIGNAVAYSPSDTPVTLRSYVAGDDAVVEVHNLGDAIDDARLPTLFEPLRRGGHRFDLQTRSIGLGLFIVRGIARAHGGDVEVRSCEADGTTFVLRLPRTTRIPPEEA